MGLKFADIFTSLTIRILMNPVCLSNETIPTISCTICSFNKHEVQVFSTSMVLKNINKKIEKMQPMKRVSRVLI